MPRLHAPSHSLAQADCSGVEIITVEGIIDALSKAHRQLLVDLRPEHRGPVLGWHCQHLQKTLVCSQGHSVLHSCQCGGILGTVISVWFLTVSRSVPGSSVHPYPLSSCYPEGSRSHKSRHHPQPACLPPTPTSTHCPAPDTHTCQPSPPALPEPCRVS